MEDYGGLGGHGRRTRKIDEWKFRSPFHDKAAHDADYTATIHMFSKYLAKVDGKQYQMMFSARSKHFESSLEDTDIDRLHQRVEREFQKQDMKAREVLWEDWIEVEVDHGAYMYKDENGAGLTIGYKFLKRGTHPTTGEIFTINNNNVVVAFPKPKLRDTEDHKAPDDEWHLGSRDRTKQFSYIPATPANVAALESLCGRIVDLRIRLSELLTQDTVQKSLSGDLARLLPPPKK